MGTFSGIVTEITAALQANTELSDIVFTQQFPIGVKPNPMKKIHAAIGLESAAVENGAFGGYFGIQNACELHGRRAELTVRIAIYAPHSMGGEACTGAFSRICDALIFGSTMGVYAVNAGKMSYEGEAAAFVTQCSAKLRLYLGQEGGNEAVQSIIVKGVLD